jgi:hypothetical protein
MHTDTQFHPSKGQNFALAKAPELRQLRVDPERWRTLDAFETVGFASDL